MTMLTVQERLAGVAKILDVSNSDLRGSAATYSGFIPARPSHLIASVLKLIERAPKTSVSLDLGCGNGAWTLLMAAAGYPSYGIDLNIDLVNSARENLVLAVEQGFIDPATPCGFIVGDMIPMKYSVEYDVYRKAHTRHDWNMPIAAVIEDAYARLPVSVATADIIYCWAWPTQSRFLYNMLEREAKQGAIFVLPSYIRYTQGEYMWSHEEKNLLNLKSLLADGENYIGVRIEASLR